ncbi:hypothetical protein PtA15_14A70 [Puccinia triticina]|uniref:Uncharacterized protein n=1 Tax=Puccinia triticina TaxID=208348 RepID=A0ABY7D0U7_9BASI|nr:uncharacterized protein PtA15_14A70 [Puccinia triticina]WAQ91189.1 hypothetical protein PtA15_14A70 [Puccinia triticina]
MRGASHGPPDHGIASVDGQQTPADREALLPLNKITLVPVGCYSSSPLTPNEVCVHLQVYVHHKCRVVFEPIKCPLSCFPVWLSVQGGI